MCADLNRLINSACGTVVAEVMTLPISTIKTNFQNTPSKTIVGTTLNLYEKGGFKIFYATSLPAIASQVLSSSSKYVFYRHLEDMHLKNSNKVLNGLLSGIASSLITHPFDSVKIHMQMSTPFIPQLRKHGLFLFYRGYSKTFGKVIVSSSLLMPIYDVCKEKFNPVTSGLVAGFVGSFCMQPIDYLKTRHVYGLPYYAGYNPLTYYKGFSLTALRIVPHFMITMAIIELLESKKN